MTSSEGARDYWLENALKLGERRTTCVLILELVQTSGQLCSMSETLGRVVSSLLSAKLPFNLRDPQ